MTSQSSMLQKAKCATSSRKKTINLITISKLITQEMCNLQQTTNPNGFHEDLKSWCRKENELCRPKTKISVALLRICIYTTAHESESVAEIFIFRYYISWQKAPLRKSRNEAVNTDFLEAFQVR